MNSTEIVSKAEKFSTISNHFETNISKYRKQIAVHIDHERLVSVALSSIRNSPGLLACTEASLFSAILEAGRYGLYIDDSVGQAYLVPFKNTKTINGRKVKVDEATLLIGFKGWMKLCRNSKEISMMFAEVVYEKDDFSYELGLDPKLYHVPSPLPIKERGNVVYAYAVGHLKDGGKQFKVMSYEEVEAVRAISKSKDSPAWRYHWNEMAKKCCITRLCKYLPMSTEAERLRTRQETMDVGDTPQFEDADFEVVQPESLDELTEKINNPKANDDEPKAKTHEPVKKQHTEADRDKLRDELSAKRYQGVTYGSLSQEWKDNIDEQVAVLIAGQE